MKLAPSCLRLHSVGVVLCAFLACGTQSGDAAARTSAATDVRLLESDLTSADSWNTEGLEANVCLLQVHSHYLLQGGAQRLADDSSLRLPKGAQDARRLERIRTEVGIFVVCVVFAFASMAAVYNGGAGAAKGKRGKEVVEGSSRQEEPTAEAPSVGEQVAESYDLLARFDFVSRLLEDKLDAREINVSASNSNLLYGLYMQATCGDVRGRRPWVLRPKDRAKWDSWANQRGQSTDDAMARYVEVACNEMQEPEETEQSGDLRSQFDKAANDLEEINRNGKVDIPPADLLVAYGLYKQANCGDNQSAQPWAHNIKLRAKWDSWAALKGMAPSEAMKKYIGVVKQFQASQ